MDTMAWPVMKVSVYNWIAFQIVAGINLVRILGCFVAIQLICISFTECQCNMETTLFCSKTIGCMCKFGWGGDNCEQGEPKWPKL